MSIGLRLDFYLFMIYVYIYVFMYKPIVQQFTQSKRLRRQISTVGLNINKNLIFTMSRRNN